MSLKIYLTTSFNQVGVPLKWGTPICILFLLLSNCHTSIEEKKLPEIDTRPYPLEIPVGFPELIIPKDNALTISRVALGKQLFYEPLLSLDSTLTCASCHILSKGLADNLAISPGVGGKMGFRNPPTLTNVAYLTRINKDGGVVKLGLQALVPIEDEDEMHLPIREAANRLAEQSKYVELAQKAYGRNPDPYVISRALAAFERTMISGDSPYDRYTFQNKKEVLSPTELSGKDLFFSEKTNCSKCHTGFNFTDNSFKNNGLYLDYKDFGRMRVTSLEKDKGLFRVPTLRNVGLTAPYMHDGSVADLEAVLDHYTSGGVQHPNQSTLVRPFELSLSERADLIAFLHTLTDSTFINNQEFLP